MTDEHFPLVDSLDHEILMHREAHFGGQFTVMIDYYKKEGVGAQPDFSLTKIEALATVEKELGQNLAPLCLAGEEIERIAEAREAYRQLKNLYEGTEKLTPARLLADLILSEEETPTAEIEALVAMAEKGKVEKERIVSLLLEALKGENLHNPLFPGYGRSASLMTQVLQRIGDKRAIITLFESIGKGDFFEDEQTLRALSAIGRPALEFLLNVVKGKPISEDNEKAAIALLSLKEDKEHEEQIAEACLALLRDKEYLRDPCLATYLVLGCTGLKSEAARAEFKQIFGLGEKREEREKSLSLLNADANAVVKGWVHTERDSENGF